MRRIIPCLVIVLWAATGFAQVWEKLVQPGLTYRMEVDSRVPRIMHALRWSQGAPELEARSELAGPAIFDSSADRGRETLSAMARRVEAVAAVNGDFFPFTGDPLGAMVRRRELLSRPWPGRPVFAWGPQSSAVATLSWRGSIESDPPSLKIDLDGFNEETPNDGLTLFTEASGLALAKPASVYVVLKLGEGAWTPTVNRSAEVLSMTADVEALAIPPGGAILAARGRKVAELAKFVPGTKLKVMYETSGLDWSQSEHVLAGGPTLVSRGQVRVDWQPAGFRDTFALRRHPRTAIGRTRTGDIWVVAVDGRQPMSEGATLDELAGIMLRLGCTDAINLDGGGSTGLSLQGALMNRPSEGSERKISNGWVLVRTQAPVVPVQADATPVFQGPKALTLGQNRTYAVLGPDGARITNLEILWSAQGSIWVDQDGVVRPFREGPGRLVAVVRGQRIELDVIVEPTPKPPVSRRSP